MTPVQAGRQELVSEGEHLYHQSSLLYILQECDNMQALPEPSSYQLKIHQSAEKPAE